MEIIKFYQKARKFIIAKGFENDIKWCESLKLEETTATRFFQEYIWCVLNAGMREQVARKIYDRFIKRLDLETIGHLGKREAINTGLKNYKIWFEKLLKSDDKIDFLESLPWIGKITKYHLARNIGIDCVKPDRHLKRIAERFGFQDPLEMCKEIQKITNERLGVIDVILWRYANLKGSKKSQLKQKELEVV